MIMQVLPSVANGIIRAPSSKSMAHRLLICGGLAEGVSTIDGIDSSEDILATLDCLRALGADCVYDGKTAQVRGVGGHPAAGKTLVCRESGSTLRFMIPICLLSDAEHTLKGTEKLLSRPLSVYESIFAKHQIRHHKEKEQFSLCGSLQAGEYSIPGDISSQFITGLLFALPLLPKSSRISLLPPVESRSYINMTIQALQAYGVSVCWQDENTLLIPGGQAYTARQIEVEGDCSNAAFLEALNITGGCVQVDDHAQGTLQGDKVYREHISSLRQGYARIDLADCPDLGPILFAVAAACHGARFTSTARLRLKESDRVAAMAQELSAFGVEAEVT